MPLGESSNVSYILSRPLFPKVPDQGLTKLPVESVSGYVIDESGSTLSSRPIRKCPGVRVLIPSSLSGSGTSGLLLRQASICVSTVYNSSKVSLTSPTTHLRCVFIDLTAASQRPTK